MLMMLEILKYTIITLEPNSFADEIATESWKSASHNSLKLIKKGLQYYVLGLGESMSTVTNYENVG